jgi:uncharacterized protein YciI
MNALADDGFLLFAGPLAGTEHGRPRALLIIDAQSEPDIHHRLAENPWTQSEQLDVTRIEPWKLFVGAARLERGQHGAEHGRSALTASNYR